MSRGLFILAAMLLVTGSARADVCSRSDYAIGLHGGTYTDGDIIRVERLDLIRDLAARVKDELSAGLDAVSAVEMAVAAMESSALYNAGRASVTNEDGYVETDASIMSGHDLNAGSVGSLTNTKSPVKAARLVMDRSRHVMVVGERGEAYVRELGAEAAPEGWFVRADPTRDEHGTVGAVALDRCGDLAAATSTGGYGTKVPGRLGDTPVIGAGTYADNRGAAVSATGHGEWFIRHSVAHSISMLTEGGLSVSDASRLVLERMAKAGGYGAVITLDADGNFAAPHSTKGVIHAFASAATEAYSEKTSGDPLGR